MEKKTFVIQFIRTRTPLQNEYKIVETGDLTKFLDTCQKITKPFIELVSAIEVFQRGGQYFYFSNDEQDEQHKRGLKVNNVDGKWKDTHYHYKSGKDNRVGNYDLGSFF